MRICNRGWNIIDSIVRGLARKGDEVVCKGPAHNVLKDIWSYSIDFHRFDDLGKTQRETLFRLKMQEEEQASPQVEESKSTLGED